MFTSVTICCRKRHNIGSIRRNYRIYLTLGKYYGSLLINTKERSTVNIKEEERKVFNYMKRMRLIMDDKTENELKISEVLDCYCKRYNRKRQNREDEARGDDIEERIEEDERMVYYLNGVVYLL